MAETAETKEAVPTPGMPAFDAFSAIEAARKRYRELMLPVLLDLSKAHPDLGKATLEILNREDFESEVAERGEADSSGWVFRRLREMDVFVKEPDFRLLLFAAFANHLRELRKAGA